MAALQSSELPHLGTFVKVAELGGFTAAAAGLGITQAAVSQRIALLEKRLQISLFERRVGRTCLTEAGRRLYEYGRKILDLHEQASEATRRPSFTHFRELIGRGKLGPGRMHFARFAPCVSGEISPSACPGDGE